MKAFYMYASFEFWMDHLAKHGELVGVAAQNALHHHAHVHLDVHLGRLEVIAPHRGREAGDQRAKQAPPHRSCVLADWQAGRVTGDLCSLRKFRLDLYSFQSVPAVWNFCIAECRTWHKEGHQGKERDRRRTASANRQTHQKRRVKRHQSVTTPRRVSV